MDQFHSNTLNVRITQLLGRIIRGRQDFGYFLIADRSVENWLKNERNRALLSELLRKQLYLSEAIEEQLSNKFDALSNAEMLMKLINRDAGWIDFYRDNINEMDVPAAKLQENEKSEAILESAGRSEVRFMTKLWDGDIDGAPRELEPVIKEIAIVDPMLPGWYSIWVGLAYYAGGKTDAAIDFFDEAVAEERREARKPRRRDVQDTAFRQLAGPGVRLRFQTDAWTATGGKQGGKAGLPLGSPRRRPLRSPDLRRRSLLRLYGRSGQQLRRRPRGGPGRRPGKAGGKAVSRDLQVRRRQ